MDSKNSWQGGKKPNQAPGKDTRSFHVLARGVTAKRPGCPKWPNYGKLHGMAGAHHCHLKKGRPTYVAVWWEVKEEEKIIEVIYVGTHEKAPY